MISQSPNIQQNFRYGTKGRNHNAVPVLRMSCIYGKDLFTVSVFVWSWTWGIRAASAVFMHSDALIMIALPEAATQRRYWSIRRTVGTTHLGVLWNTLEGARHWIDRVFVFKLLLSFAEVFCSVCRADSTPLSLFGLLCYRRYWYGVRHDECLYVFLYRYLLNSRTHIFSFLQHRTLE